MVRNVTWIWIDYPIRWVRTGAHLPKVTCTWPPARQPSWSSANSRKRSLPTDDANLQATLAHSARTNERLFFSPLVDPAQAHPWMFALTVSVSVTVSILFVFFSLPISLFFSWYLNSGTQVTPVRIYFLFLFLSLI